MITLWIGIALAGPAPEGVDLEDLDHWESRSRALLEGPQGCWDLSGTLEVQLALFTPPGLWKRAEKRTLRASGSFRGQIDGGTWRSFDYTMTVTDDSDLELDTDDHIFVPVFPLIGEIDQAVVNADEQEPPPPGEGSVSISVGSSSGLEITSSSSEAMNLLDEIMEAIKPSATTSYAQWFDEPAGVKLLQDAPINDSPRSPRLTLSTFFPDGAPHATELDVDFPPRYKAGKGLIRITLIEPQMHLRGKVVGEEILPTIESSSLVAGALGFTVGYEQKITYDRATACTSSPSTSPSGETEPR